MVDVWPATLPQRFDREGFRNEEPDGRIFSETDAGPAKTRLRSAAMPEPVEGSMMMTKAQRDILRTFIRATLIGGSLPFSFPMPGEDGVNVLVRFAKDGLPSWSNLGGPWWSANMRLEIMPGGPL